MKAILFVTGEVGGAVEALGRARSGLTSANLRVLVRVEQREELVRVGGLLPHQVLGFTAAGWLWVWLQLFWFLGSSRQVQVICLAAGHSRALKLMAFALRGRVTFTLPAGEEVSLSLPRFLWLAWLTRRPNRVTVLGSASGLYLKTIVADLRRRYPGAALHGLLPVRLVGPAAHLFDSYTPLRVFSPGCWQDLLSLSLGRNRSGHLVIPCTNEGYTHIKVLGFWLPLGLREIYNENGDAYLAWRLRIVWRHFSWRLEHRIFYQALTVRRRRPWLLHLVHLLLYPLRLAAGAALLVGVLWRSRQGSRRVSGQSAAPEEGALSEDVLALANSQVQRGTPVVRGDP